MGGGMLCTRCGECVGGVRVQRRQQEGRMRRQHSHPPKPPTHLELPVSNTVSFWGRSGGGRGCVVCLVVGIH